MAVRGLCHPLYHPLLTQFRRLYLHHTEQVQTQIFVVGSFQQQLMCIECVAQEVQIIPIRPEVNKV